MKRKILVATVLLVVATLTARADNDKKTPPMPLKIVNLDTAAEVLSTTTKVLSIEKTVPWVEVLVAGLEIPPLVFRTGKGATLSVDLTFDTSETNEDVYQKYVSALENLTKVNPDLHRPPRVLVTWGSNKTFTGVIESLSVKYTLFLSDGRPARAEVVLSVKQAETAQIPS